MMIPRALTRSALAATALFASILLAKGAPVSDPLDITFFTTGNFRSDDGPYKHGVDGVVAYFPGTGNMVLDPDGDAKGKNAVRRSVKLQLNPTGNGGPLPAGEYDTYFLSINAIGLDCWGNASTTAPRDLGLNECIQAGVAVNDIEGSGYLLRCGQAGAGLDTVQVTCVEDSGVCQQWTVESGATLHCALFRIVKTKLVRQHQDPYDVPFTATVARQ